jgi:phosphoribosyl-ATP pyrophosphohydrolase/phosphoribosyl-AMP cyclohydrolase/histidinol dehydrogenase
MTAPLLRRVDAAAVPPRLAAGLDATTLAAAGEIVTDVRANGTDALLRCAARFDGWSPGRPWRFERPALEAALAAIDGQARAVLERAAQRIRTFATAQRSALTSLKVSVPGGAVGHDVVAMERAGCYAPAGRFPLPSSLLMTAVTARAAGVREVVVASPNPGPLMLAAAAIADVDVVLGVGGAQAIAALAYGVGVGACDIVVGPGNRWVTAAKKCVAGDVAIDMLAGPSELVVVADADADAGTVAADLLAQAEHDADAFTALVVTDARVIDATERELRRQLESLPTRDVAIAALRNGMAVCCADLRQVAEVCNILAPEHLQLSIRDPESLAARIRNAGALFLGERSAEVFGDYGVGGNHVLPTGRGARFSGGLSVLTFQRVRTWLRLDDATNVVQDVAALARLEGLEAHARAAERRRMPYVGGAAGS